MAFGTTQSSSVPLTGDAEHKRLVKEKAELVADISAIGKQIEEGEKTLSQYKGLEKKIYDKEDVLEGLAVEESRLLFLVSSLKEEAQKTAQLSAEKKAIEDALAAAKDSLYKIGLEIEKKTEALAALVVDFSKKEKNLKETISELDVIKQTKESEVGSLTVELQSLRADLASVAALKEVKLAALRDVDGRLAVLFRAETQKQEQITDLDSQIDAKKKEIGTVELELAEKRAKDVVWFSEEKDILRQKEEELASREGALSQRSSMIESRASLLRAAKVRLEHHLGRTLDVNIE